MPRLDERLKSVCRQIRNESHVDVGSDHGHLLKVLLLTNRIQFGIAIENKRLPFLNSQQTLMNMNADVRFGFGFEPVNVGEAESASICGMGGGTIRKILERSPGRIPSKLVLQPNNRSDAVRDWAWNHQFRLVDEWWTEGSRRFEVLVFEASTSATDPAYEGLPIEVAIQLGPFHLRRRLTHDVSRWREEAEYLQMLKQRNAFAERRYRVINSALSLQPTVAADSSPTSLHSGSIPQPPRA